MFGTGDDYIQYSARNAQRIAALAPGSGWCAAQPDLDHIPVVYFHDNEKADALVRKGLGGAEPRFELFYLGTRANPTMAKFEALPTQRRWARDYKWLRPQYYKRSPFRTTLNMDGDAVPCGARLVEAFRAFAESKAAVAGLWHVGASYSGLNTGFMAWDKEKAAPLLAAWADGMRSAILANRTIRHDQPSLAAALNATRGVSVLRFSEENVCRVCRADNEFRLRVDVRVGRLLGRPPRLGPELQQGRHRRHRQGGRRHQGVEEVESAPGQLESAHRSSLPPVVASGVSPSSHRGHPHRSLPAAGWAHAKISLVFGRTDASAFLADRSAQDCCPEFDFTQIGRVPDNFGRPSRVAAAKMMVVSTQIRPHRAV